MALLVEFGVGLCVEGRDRQRETADCSALCPSAHIWGCFAWEFWEESFAFRRSLQVSEYLVCAAQFGLCAIRMWLLIVREIDGGWGFR